jgi:hypothetical protein
MNGHYGQTSLPIVEHLQKEKARQGIMTGVPWHHKRELKTLRHHIHIGRSAMINKGGVLTRDGGILGELANNFANFRGHKRFTCKRQAVRNLAITKHMFI